jgi:hypothetical protein
VATPPSAPPAPAARPVSEPRKVATADDDDTPAPKATPRKVHRTSAKQQRRIEARTRVARRPEARTRTAADDDFSMPRAQQPSYVRVIDLPNGERVYQRLKGDQAAAMGYGPGAHTERRGPTLPDFFD